MVDDNENVVDNTVTGKTSVFLAWSGTVSQKMALLLKKYLPLFVRSVDIFISEDITKGKRWHTEIAKALGSTKFGILCLTPENLTSEWIHFEAGALSKTIDDSTHVCPLLLDVKKSELKEPLASFHATLFNEKEFKELVNDLAKACGDGLEGEQLATLMEALWPKINDNIKELKAELVEARKKSGEPEEAKPKIDPLLEEVLVRIREQGRVLASLIEQSQMNPVMEIQEAIYRLKSGQRRMMNMLEMNDRRRSSRDSEEEDNRIRKTYHYSPKMRSKKMAEILKFFPVSFMKTNDPENVLDASIRTGQISEDLLEAFGGRADAIQEIAFWMGLNGFLNKDDET